MRWYFFVFVLTLVILVVSCSNSLAFSGKAYNDLSNDQKQAYWSCFNDSNKNCQDLLNKKDKNYRQCSLDCFNKAKSITIAQAWCKDSDNGNNFIEKGLVTTNIYPQGKEDSCHTFSNINKTYLFEGQCKDNKYQYLQKDCTELGEDYSCNNGACKSDVTYDGDGEYIVKKGDIIKADNGIKITIFEITLYDKTETYPDEKINSNVGDYVIYYDLSVKKELLNAIPYMRRWVNQSSCPTCNYFPSLFGVSLIPHKEIINESGEIKITLEIKSDSKNKINSCQDYYNKCIQYQIAKKGSLDPIKDLICRVSYCPLSPVAGEEIIKKNNYTVIYPSDYQIQASMALSELQSCDAYQDDNGFEKYKWINRYALRIAPKKIYGQSPSVTTAAGTYYSLSDTKEKNVIDDPVICENGVIAHELVHYRTEYANELSSLKEGLAQILTDKIGEESHLECGESNFTHTNKCSYNFSMVLACGLKPMKNIQLSLGKINQVAGYNITYVSSGNMTNSNTEKWFNVTFQNETETNFILITNSPISQIIYLNESSGLILNGFYKDTITLTFFYISEGISLNAFKNCVNESVYCKTEKYGSLSKNYGSDTVYPSSYCFFVRMKQVYGEEILKKYYESLKKSAEEIIPFCIDQFLLSQGTKEEYDQLAKNFGLINGSTCGSIPLVFEPWDSGQKVKG